MVRPLQSRPENSLGSEPGFSFRELLAVLFLEPQLLLLVAGPKWGSALRRMLATAALAGLLVSVFAAPRIYRAAQAWATWFGQDVGAAWIEDGTLHWQQPQDLPATRYHQDWRIDFVDAAAAFDPKIRLGPERRGLWVSPRAVYWWRRMPENDQVVATMMLSPRVMGMLEEKAASDGGFRIEGDEFKQHGRWLTFTVLIPGYIVFQIVLIVSETLFYALIFALVPFLLRVPMAARGFGQVFSFYLYLAIPPLVVATVYTALGLPGVSFSTLFAFAYVFYLLYVLWQVRRTFRAAEPPRQSL